MKNTLISDSIANGNEINLIENVEIIKKKNVMINNDIFRTRKQQKLKIFRKSHDDNLVF